MSDQSTPHDPDECAQCGYVLRPCGTSPEFWCSQTCMEAWTAENVTAGTPAPTWGRLASVGASATSPVTGAAVVRDAWPWLDARRT